MRSYYYLVRYFVTSSCYYCARFTYHEFYIMRRAKNKINIITRMIPTQKASKESCAFAEKEMSTRSVIHLSNSFISPHSSYNWIDYRRSHTANPQSDSNPLQKVTGNLSLFGEDWSHFAGWRYDRHLHKIIKLYWRFNGNSIELVVKTVTKSFPSKAQNPVWVTDFLHRISF
jgi:hypothetical protein